MKEAADTLSNFQIRSTVVSDRYVEFGSWYLVTVAQFKVEDYSRSTMVA